MCGLQGPGCTEAADELVGVERHELVASVGLGPVILPFERHALAVEGDEPAVGNGDPVGVAGQVGEHRIGPAKRSLGIETHSTLRSAARKVWKAAGWARPA